MFTKLPRWVEVGSFWLAAIAGAVNAVGLLGFKHQAVSHLTGTATLLGLAIANRDVLDGSHLLFVILAFVLGATLGGILIGKETLRLGRRYGVTLLIEAALLLLAMYALTQGLIIGHLLASAACGLQNSMVSTYSGATLRTTHMSGLFTDLGTMLGHKLRGHPLDTRRVRLYLLLITGFTAGGSLGAYSFHHLQFAALAIPAGAATLLAIISWIYSQKIRRQQG